MRVSLRKRLLGAFVITLLGAALLSFTSYRTIDRTVFVLGEVFANDFKPYQQISDMTIAYLKWMRSIDRIVESTTPEDGLQAERSEREHRMTMESRLRERLSGTISPEGLPLLTRIDENTRAAIAIKESIVAAKREGRTEAANALQNNELETVARELESTIMEYLNLQERQFLEENDQASSDAHRSIRQITLLLVIVGVITILAAVTTYATLAMTLRRVQAASRDIAASSSEVVATTAELTSSAVETGTAINEVTTTVEETRQTARSSNEKAQSVSDSAQKVAHISVSGRKVIEQTIESMKAIQHEMMVVGQSIMKLSEQSQSVGQIIGSVNELAEATNILSVNASIEAARAGEHGRGFGVVAQEIRNLAERSKQATGRIREILTDIQKATSSAVLITEQASKKVDAGVQHSSEANEAIQILSNSIAEASQAAIQIAASNAQQLAGVDQMSEAMLNINQATQQNVSSLKQLESAMRSLDELGERLKDVVAIL